MDGSFIKVSIEVKRLIQFKFPKQIPSMLNIYYYEYT